MRILIITHFFPPGHIGGTETLTAAIAESLNQHHDVQVLCAENWDTAPSHEIQATDDHYQNIPVRRLHFNWQKAPDVFGYLYNNPEVERYLDQYLAELQPDIVHITSCYSLSASVITAAHKAGIPIVLTATDFWFLCARNTLLQRDGSLCSGPESAWKCAKCNLAQSKAYHWPRAVLPETIVKTGLMSIAPFPVITRQRGFRGLHGNWEGRFEYLREALQKVDQIVTASSFLRSLLIDYGVEESRIEFSAYGLDTRWAEGFQTKTPSDKLRFGFIGQLIPIKGPDILIRAFRELDPSVPAELLIYGDSNKNPEYGQQLAQLAEGDPRIKFMGTFPYDEIGRVLTAMDVMVAPSTWYDFPLVIPSAFATNTPVIATDMAGMNELVRDEVDGLLFPRHDVAALARQLQRLVDDPTLVPCLQQGIQPVKTIEQMMDFYLEIYTELKGRAFDVSPLQKPVNVSKV